MVIYQEHYEIGSFACGRVHRYPAIRDGVANRRTMWRVGVAPGPRYQEDNCEQGGEGR